MRTLRELGGWLLFALVLLTPFVGLGGLVLLFETPMPCAFVLFAGLLVLSWPRWILTSLRLRDPSPHDVAEADGRAPVFVVHRFAHVSEPFIARLFVPAPALFREIADAWTLRSLARTFAPIGPVIPIERIGPAWLDDPAVPKVEPAYDEALERAFKRAAMAAIVLDGSEANAREIERAFQHLGPRTVLILPRQRDDVFKARYEAMRARIPLLPELSDPYAVAIRYDASAMPYLQRTIVLLDEEKTPIPQAPPISWALVVIPLVAGLFSAIASPIVADAYGADLPDEAIVSGVLAMLTIGVMMGVLSRRYVRLVPANDAVMISLAAFPWLAAALITFVDSAGHHPYDIAERLRLTAVGAAYAAPMLTAAALVLAGASLVRNTERRRPIHALFGLAALSPFAIVVLVLASAAEEWGLILFSLFVNAIAIAIASYAASGDAKRKHAPLPIGAVLAAVASVAATALVVAQETWNVLLRQMSVPDAISVLERHAIGPALTAFAWLWPLFVLVIPAVIIAIGGRFRGRATRTAAASLAAFVPLALVVALTTGAEANARAFLRTPFAGANVDPLLPARGVHLRPGFTLVQTPAAQGHGQTWAAADVVLDTSGAILFGERIADEEELESSRQSGGPPALTDALAQLAAQRPGDVLRVSVRADASAGLLLSLLASARTAGWSDIELLVLAAPIDVRSVRVRSYDARLGRLPNQIPLYLRIGAYGVTLDDPLVGGPRPIPRTPEALDEPALTTALAGSQAMGGDRAIRLMVDPSVRVSQLVQGATYAGTYFPQVLISDGAYRL